MRKIITLFLALCSFSFAGDQFWVNFGRDPRGWLMMFPAPTEATIYENARAALDILEVKCDGELVRPEVNGLSGYHQPIEIRSPGGNVIYSISTKNLWTFKGIDPGPNGWAIKEFKIPDAAKIIVVTYLVRFPGGKTSSPLRVTFVDSDKGPEHLVLPADKK